MYLLEDFQVQMPVFHEPLKPQYHLKSVPTWCKLLTLWNCDIIYLHAKQYILKQCKICPVHIIATDCKYVVSEEVNKNVLITSHQVCVNLQSDPRL